MLVTAVVNDKFELALRSDAIGASTRACEGVEGVDESGESAGGDQGRTEGSNIIADLSVQGV
jgi:hypothetical protein